MRIIKEFYSGKGDKTAKTMFDTAVIRDGSQTLTATLNYLKNNITGELTEDPVQKFEAALNA